MKRIAVGDRWLGEDAPCYVIAEAGANHNRDLGLARQLIDVAAEAGADAVKFQTYSAETLYSKKTPRFKYLKDVSAQDTFDLLKSLEIPREWHALLAEHCAARGVQFFSTPFDHAAVDELAEVGVPCFKIASFEIVDLPLIAHVAAKGKPVIISTGMSSLTDIEDAVGACRSAGNEQVILLQCASLYPSPPEIMNLRSMATMRAAFGCPVGLSDHTTGISVPIGAVAMGADTIEKHFTLDRTMKGPDHPFAIEPAELKAMVRGIRDVEAAQGTGLKTGPSTAEAEEMYRLARRSIVAAQAIPQGTTITREMLTVKRPGFGILPKYIDLVVGRTARVAIEPDDVVTWDLV